MAEGTYLFPVPEGATIDQFTMTVDGKEVEAQILEADEAREIYEEIVAEMRDPALLEYIGQNVIQASIFPIEPGDDASVQIDYQQVLTAEGGVVHYRYPLNTERFSAEPIESVSVSVEVTSDEPVRAIYSPSHEIVVDKEGENSFVAGWEANDVKPDTDFDLFYTLSDNAIGVNLLSYWSEQDDQGTFMILAAPGIPAQETAISKDVIVVLDTSGSMEGEKIEQAKEALVYILENLNEGDRFTIVEFSTGVRLYENELLNATPRRRTRSTWVERLQSDGGTNIDEALTEAMDLVDERAPDLCPLPDRRAADRRRNRHAGYSGECQPSCSGERAPLRLRRRRRCRYGAAGQSGGRASGASSYVRPGERLDESVSAFYAKISTPVLTNVELTDRRRRHAKRSIPTRCRTSSPARNS